MVLTKYDPTLQAPPMAEWDPDEITAHMEYLRALNRALIENGELVEAQALTGPELAKIVMHEERAIEIAAQVSAAPGPRGVPLRQRIEVRQVMSPLRVPTC